GLEHARPTDAKNLAQGAAADGADPRRPAAVVSPAPIAHRRNGVGAARLPRIGAARTRSGRRDGPLLHGGLPAFRLHPRPGACLELGANPYFTTMLLRRFSAADWTLANYFGPNHGERRGVSPMCDTRVQRVVFREPATQEMTHVDLPFHHFNVEEDRFPFVDA